MNFNEWFDYYIELGRTLELQRQEEIALRKVFLDQNQLLLAINTREVNLLSGKDFGDFF